MFSHPARAKQLTLDTQEGDFVQRIHCAQLCVEFQRIDDLDGFPDPYMLRAQIAMPIADITRAYPCAKNRCESRKKLTLDAVNQPYLTDGQPEPAIEQNSAIVGYSAPPFHHMSRPTRENRTDPLIEARQDLSNSVDVSMIQAFAGQELIEHAICGEAAHHDQPIDRPSSSTDCQPSAIQRQWDDIEIDVRCQPTIEPELGSTCGLTVLNGRKIQVRKADGLLQLINTVSRKKDPRHMSLFAFHTIHRRRI